MDPMLPVVEHGVVGPPKAIKQAPIRGRRQRGPYVMRRAHVVRAISRETGTPEATIEAVLDSLNNLAARDLMLWGKFIFPGCLHITFLFYCCCCNIHSTYVYSG